MFKNWGIRARILLLALAPAIGVAALLSGYFIYTSARDVDRDLREYGLGLARQLAAIAEYSTFTGDRQTLNGIALAALDETHVGAVEMFDAKGDPLASSGALPGSLHPLPRQTTSFVAEDDEEHLRLIAPILQHRFEMQDPFLVDNLTANPGRPALLGWVAVEVSKDSVKQRKKDTVIFILTIVTLTVAGTSLLATILVRQVTRPILRLERGVADIRKGNLRLRLPADGGGEMQRLEEGFNTMAEELDTSRSNLETRIREATAQLEQKRAEAERASLAKSRFLAAASHDLRQPLHALNLFVADLQRSPLPADGQRLAGQIASSITAMSELLSALLDISRLDVAGIHPQPKPFPVARLFARIEAAFQAGARDKGLRLRCHPGPYWLLGDQALVERVLANLLANALQYTAQGTILVAARRRGDQIQVEVRDSGIGIAPQYHEAIFQEFFQVGNKAREQHKGLGLGLAIVDRLAKAMGAPIHLHSAPDQGSCFYFQLPQAAAEAEAPAPSPRVVLPCYGTGFMSATAQTLGHWLSEWNLPYVNAPSADAAREAMAAAGQGVYLAIGNGSVLAELLENAPDASGILICPTGESCANPRWQTLPHPVRPAKLRALLQSLLPAVPTA